jgi:preprotein translocase subunit SecA
MGVARSPQQLYHHILDEMQKNPSVLPLSVYKEFLRFFIATFGRLKYKAADGEIRDVKCMHARPERAIAKLNQQQNMILPTTTISQTSIQEAENRRRISSLFQHEIRWNDTAQRTERVIKVVDRPVTIIYTLNLWSKYVADMDQLAAQVRLMFNPTMVLDTPSNSTSQIFLDSESDNFTMNLADREDRIVKRSFNLRLETYIPNPKFLVTSTGEIQSLETEVEIGDC